MIKNRLTPILIAVALFVLPLAARAATQPVFSFGGLNFSGLTIIDTSNPLSTRGFFQVDQIRSEGDGSIVYQSGRGKEILGVFSDFDRLDTQLGLGGSVNFSSVGGVVNFYETAANTFQITGNYDADTAGIITGDLLLGAAGHVDDNGYTAIGTVTENTYGSTGSLDFLTGALLASFDNNSVVFNGADALFNLSGSRSIIYPFQGSSDVMTIEQVIIPTVEVSQVPVPASAWLFGSAFLGMTGAVSMRKR